MQVLGKEKSTKGEGSYGDSKVLFVDQSGKLGGAELFLFDVALSLRNRCQVALFEDGPFNELLESSTIPVAIIGKGFRMTKQSGLSSALRAIPSAIGITFRLARLAAKFDVLYANTAKAFVLGCIAAKLANKPLIYHLHDIVSASHFSRMNRWLLVFCANHFASAVIANSKASKEAFCLAGCRNPLIDVVYNGFKAEDFRADPKLAADVRQKYNIGDKLLAILVGRLTSWKGQHVFIETLSRLPDWHGLLVGDALFTHEDQSYAKELKEKVQKMGLQDRIHFTGFQSDLRRFYSAADVVVHCSVAPEPFGRVIVEGMLAGKPVIATRLGGAVEILADDVTGMLVLPDDVDALSDALRFCQDQPKQVRQMADSGRDYAVRHFSLDQIIGQLERLIERPIP